MPVLFRVVTMPNGRGPTVKFGPGYEKYRQTCTEVPKVPSNVHPRYQKDLQTCTEVPKGPPNVHRDTKRPSGTKRTGTKRPSAAPNVPRRSEKDRRLQNVPAREVRKGPRRKCKGTKRTVISKTYRHVRSEMDRYAREWTAGNGLTGLVPLPKNSALFAKFKNNGRIMGLKTLPYSPK